MTARNGRQGTFSMDDDTIGTDVILPIILAFVFIIGLAALFGRQ